MHASWHVREQFRDQPLLLSSLKIVLSMKWSTMKDICGNTVCDYSPWIISTCSCQSFKLRVLESQRRGWAAESITACSMATIIYSSVNSSSQGYIQPPPNIRQSNLCSLHEKPNVSLFKHTVVKSTGCLILIPGTTIQLLSQLGQVALGSSVFSLCIFSFLSCLMEGRKHLQMSSPCWLFSTPSLLHNLHESKSQILIFTCSKSSAGFPFH